MGFINELRAIKMKKIANSTAVSEADLLSVYALYNLKFEKKKRKLACSHDEAIQAYKFIPGIS